MISTVHRAGDEIEGCQYFERDERFRCAVPSETTRECTDRKFDDPLRYIYFSLVPNRRNIVLKVSADMDIWKAFQLVRPENRFPNL